MTRENSKRLYEILLEAHRIKYPALPANCRPIEIFPDTNEKGIHKNIKQWCDAMGFKYLRTDSKATAQVKIETLNHAAGVRKKLSVHYRRSELEKGTADIEISKNNRLWCIEIKAQNKKTGYKDKQSQAQRDYEIKLKDKFGIDYWIVTGMDSFFDLYDNEISKQLP